MNPWRLLSSIPNLIRSGYDTSALGLSRFNFWWGAVLSGSVSRPDPSQASSRSCACYSSTLWRYAVGRATDVFSPCAEGELYRIRATMPNATPILYPRRFLFGSEHRMVLAGATDSKLRWSCIPKGFFLIRHNLFACT